MRYLLKLQISSILSIGLLFSACSSTTNQKEKALAEIEDHDFLGAIIRLNMALEQEGETDTIYYLRGLCYHRIWKDSLAEVDLNSALKLNVHYDEARLLLGSLRLAADDTVTARIQFEHVLASSQIRLSSDASIELGRMHYFAKDFESGIKDFDQAILRDSTNFMAWYYRGLVRSRFFNPSGITSEINYPFLDFDQALGDFSRCIDLKPDLADAWFQRAMVHFNKFDDEQGMQDINQAIALAPKYIYYYIGRAHQHVLKGRFELALVDINKAIAQNPKESSAYFERSLVYKAIGRNMESKADSLTAIHLQLEQN